MQPVHAARVELVRPCAVALDRRDQAVSGTTATVVVEVEDLTSAYTQSTTVHEGKAWAVHHTFTQTPSVLASPFEERALIAQIDRFHRDVKKFRVGFGYHVAVFPSGRSYRIGNQGTQRAHVANQNHKYDGLVFIGTYTDVIPNDVMLQEAAKIILASGMPLAGGHKDVSVEGYTECPGNWSLGYLESLLDLPSPPLTLADRALLFRYLTDTRLASGVRLTPKQMHGNRRVYEVELP